MYYDITYNDYDNYSYYYGGNFNITYDNFENENSSYDYGAKKDVNHGGLDYTFDYLYKKYAFDDLYRKSALPETEIINGYILPVLAIFTFLTNILVVWTFAVKSMRSPTTILLIALAITDSCVCISVLPTSFYFNTLGHHKTYVPYYWCFVDHYMGFTFQRIFRTTSNWITVALGIQRFVIVCRPLKAKRICTRSSSIAVCACAFILSALLELQPLVSVYIHRVPKSLANLTIGEYDGCIFEYHSLLNMNTSAYYVINGVMSKLLPCVLLMVVTIYLIVKLRTRGDIAGHIASETTVYEERVRRITSMVLAVAIVFVLAETQDVIAFSIYVYESENPSGTQILSEYVDSIWDAFGFLLSVLGYHCNFWIYIIMSRQFRMRIQGALRKINICKSDEQERTSSSYLPEL